MYTAYGVEAGLPLPDHVNESVLEDSPVNVTVEGVARSVEVEARAQGETEA